MFDLQQTIEAAEEVLKTVPEGFIYNTIRGNSCFYSVEAYQNHIAAGLTADWVTELKEPSKLATGCFVGRVLDHLGVDYDRFSGEGVGALGVDGKLDDDSIYFLESLQALQDAGKPWAEALESAREGDIGV